MSDQIYCKKLDKLGTRMTSAPWPGELGERIVNHISQEAWQEWLKQQTILINEYQLSPLNPEHKKYLKAQMEAYFFGDGITLPDQWNPS